MRSTERLLLRDTRLSDALALFAILGDAEAMRHTTHLPTLRACRRHITGYLCARRRTGHAPWTIATKASEEIIGWGGLYEDPFDRGWGVEVGYWFAPSAWGKGYATELVRASLDHARHCGLDNVSAFTRPENAGSRRVLEKTGFRMQRFVPSLQRNLYRYRID